MAGYPSLSNDLGQPQPSVTPYPIPDTNSKQPPTNLYPSIESTPGYPQSAATSGYPQPAATPGYPQPTAAPDYPQPAAAPGYPQQTAALAYPQPTAASGYPQPQASYRQPTMAPITTQPFGHFNGPASLLNMFSDMDQILVKQKKELLEAFLGCETNNKYEIKNKFGQQILFAKEDTDCCTRQCCGNARGFDIEITDNQNTEVLRISRDYACGAGLCCPCCMESVQVQSPPGTVIGTVNQKYKFMVPYFAVCDEAGNEQLYIEGPFCAFACCGTVDFTVFGNDGKTEIGKIQKQWSGLLREAFTDADLFGIDFPINLDNKMKATLLGALFLIDFMFFERSGNDS